jgi:hypothetical protein
VFAGVTRVFGDQRLIPAAPVKLPPPPGRFGVQWGESKDVNAAHDFPVQELDDSIQIVRTDGSDRQITGVAAVGIHLAMVSGGMGWTSPIYLSVCSDFRLFIGTPNWASRGSLLSPIPP